MKILLMEDDDFIGNSIKDYFEFNGHYVELYPDGVELLENAYTPEYDIFLLDISTPRKNGFETLKELRKSNPHTPAIFITALSDIKSIESGYSLGCNDYIKKPFELRELELRVLKQISPYNQNRDIKIDESYSFDLKSLRLLHKGNEVELSKNEKLFLNFLVENIGSTMTNEQLIEYVWGLKDIRDNTLRTQLTKLRQKLHSNFIKNIRGVGYKIEKPKL